MLIRMKFSFYTWAGLLDILCKTWLYSYGKIELFVDHVLLALLLPSLQLLEPLVVNAADVPAPDVQLQRFFPWKQLFFSYHIRIVDENK